MLEKNLIGMESRVVAHFCDRRATHRISRHFLYNGSTCLNIEFITQAVHRLAVDDSVQFTVVKSSRFGGQLYQQLLQVEYLVCIIRASFVGQVHELEPERLEVKRISVKFVNLKAR